MSKVNVKCKLTWKPIRHGDLYCSSACGAGCTHAAYTKAQLAATKLARQLGKGWKPVVWENMGWHWDVRKGDCTVHQSGRNDFCADLNSADTPQFIAQASSARAAINAARVKCFKALESLKQFYERAP